MQYTNRFHLLWESYLSGTLQPEDLAEFLQLLTAENGLRQDDIANLLVLHQSATIPVVEGEHIFTELQEKIKISSTPQRSVFRRLHFQRNIAAAVILVLLGVSLFYFSVRRLNSTTSIPASTEHLAADIGPATNGAILTLADHTQINLDTVSDGPLMLQGGIRVRIENGRLLYETGHDQALIHSMSTPQGRQFQLTLPDGTRVWMNAGTTLWYPTVFDSKERWVKLSGEAFFEVASNKDKPFRVKTTTDEITVLGTAFNVNAYADEAFVKTSLVEGSIKVNGLLLEPGKGYRNGQVFNTNIQQDIAWKNGLFNFNDMDIKTAMREIARWYDLQIIYEVEPRSGNISGEMERNLSLEQVMNILKGLEVNYRLDGRKLIIR